VLVVHPPQVALITRSQVMNDKIAASILARLLAKGLLVGIWIPPRTFVNCVVWWHNARR
jgi:hypothetical protein